VPALWLGADFIQGAKGPAPPPSPTGTGAAADELVGLVGADFARSPEYRGV